ncbi:MAG: YceI family protein [Rhodospirillales bacterium]
MNSFAKALTVAVFALSISTTMAAKAEDWILDGTRSNVSFGSIKSNMFGEVHHFETVTGRVSDTGTAEIVIDLASVRTLIDIRNERMVEHLFGGGAKATLKAQLDMAALEAMEVGQIEPMTVEANLAFLKQSLDLDLDVVVARLSEDEAMVASNSFFFLAAEDVGFGEGIAVLMQLAGLDSITETSPVSFRLVFDRAE